MKKTVTWLLLIASCFFFAGCQATTEVKKEDEKIKVVATNSIIADMVKNVGKDLVDLHSIVPVGTDPHEYEPLPQDITKATEADILFYNGLNLETGGNGWFAKLMDTAGKNEGEGYFSVSQNVQSLYLKDSGRQEVQDPHAWLDIRNGIAYVETIRDTLIAKDKPNKEKYEQNAQEYILSLTELDEQARQKFDDIPQEKKLLVTSEGAFRYFANSYDVPTAYIWEINTENQGTPDQMKRIIQQVEQSKVPVLFVETSVDKRSMERVSKQTGLPIYDQLFTDSIAKEGQTGDSYYSMMKWNLDTIHDGLSQ